MQVSNAYTTQDASQSSADPFHLSMKQLSISEVLADGRFAVIRRAVYMKNNVHNDVAAKALKSE
jgi:hypothetical protein